MTSDEPELINESFLHDIEAPRGMTIAEMLVERSCTSLQHSLKNPIGLARVAIPRPDTDHAKQ